MMDERVCADCDFVSQGECKERREVHDRCVKEHEDWMQRKDVEDAKRGVSDKYQTWLLSGILTILLASFLRGLGIV